ncbi:MAG: endonuclease III, partial [Candidatus Omnitrophica bacterium]|nr:endonuclease III [Candidatus Omnitrophota bacterium]
CTDKRVNLVTKDLFKKYRTAADYANANPKTFEQEIRSTGFYKNKTKSILHCCRQIVDKHSGKVPNRMEDLVELAGVGRKTANVILGNVYNIPGVVVDTHVRRLSNRMGLTTNDDPDKIEQDLMKLFPEEEWTWLSHTIILHGRQVCSARKPLCQKCPIESLCPKIGV